MLVKRLSFLKKKKARSLKLLAILVPQQYIITTYLTLNTGNFSFMVTIYIQIPLN